MFYAHVEAGCEQFRPGPGRAGAGRGPQSGSIALGASETALRHWLLPRLDRFHALYPGVRLRLFGGTSGRPSMNSSPGPSILAVAAVPGGGFRALKETRLCPLRDVFVASSAFGQLRGRDVPLDEVMRHPFICHKQGSLTFEFLESMCKTRGVDFAPAMEPDTTGWCWIWPGTAWASVFCRKWPPERPWAAGEVFALRLAEELPSRSISLLEYDGHTLSLAARRLRDLLTEDAAAGDAL